MTIMQWQCCTGSGVAFEENKEEIEQGDEYEFTPWEGRILEVVMESMRMAGLALSVRAMATICLGVIFLCFSQGCSYEIADLK